MEIILKIWYVVFFLFIGWSIAAYLKGFKMLIIVKNYKAIAGRIAGLILLILLFAPAMYIMVIDVWGK